MEGTFHPVVEHRGCQYCWHQSVLAPSALCGQSLAIAPQGHTHQVDRTTSYPDSTQSATHPLAALTKMTQLAIVAHDSDMTDIALSLASPLVPLLLLLAIVGSSCVFFLLGSILPRCTKFAPTWSDKQYSRSCMHLIVFVLSFALVCISIRTCLVRGTFQLVRVAVRECRKQ